MRWDNLSAPPDGEVPDGPAPAAPPLPLALPGTVARTFDTPGFAGMTFYEVRAKSIINRVPASSRMSFPWTINPYRGCSHACSYCLAGDTPILMAGGTTRPLRDLKVGDAIYGTVPVGASRHYTVTTVLAHWSTTKPAYRVTLADGTQLIASGDHRFLGERGWRHVIGSAAGPGLAPGDRLVGTGQFVEGPKDSADYLSGMIRGDARLDVVAIEPLGADLPLYDITTGTGDFIANGVVSHNCFARGTHTYLDLDAGHDFDTKIVVKVNAGELVRRELAAPKWRGEHIAMGTNVDPYQRAEGRYRLMPRILSALRDFANPFSILTKGTLILRDLSLLRQAAEVTQVGVAMSVGFVDERMWRSVESGTPSPRRRLDAVRALTDAGFRVSVLMAPILPGLTDTDDSIEATVAAIAASGAASITPIPLHLRPGAREWYASWLTREFPALAPHYRRLYGRGSYLPKEYQREVTARVRMAARRHGLDRADPGEARQPESPPPPPEPEQLTLL
jgi:DNA repair photolyase